MKQSFQERTNSPLLFYGNYVDFGDYDNVTNEKGNLTIGFEIEPIDFPINRFINYYNRTRNNQIATPYKINYSLNQTSIKNKTGIEVLNLNYLDANVKISFDINNSKVNEIIVNGKQYFKSSNKIYLNDGEFDFTIYERKNSEQGNFQMLSNVIETEVKRIIRNKSKKNCSEELVGRIFRNSHYSSEEYLKNLKNLNLSKFFTSKIQSWDEINPEYIDYKNLNILHDVITNIIPKINTILKSNFLNVSYSAPIRASAERYYRSKQLALDEVDSNGQNLALFLASLKPSELKSFQDWTLENFDFGVEIQNTLGHQSIFIFENRNGKKTNLSDMGFGYSQILPIITQMWFGTRKNERYKNNTISINKKVDYRNLYITIEQPELHLHPEFQAKFAKSLIKFIKFSEKESNVKFIIETHSDTIINTLGHAIVEDKLLSDHVNVYIFDKNENGDTSINRSYFDMDGNLINWPFGFFSV